MADSTEILHEAAEILRKQGGLAHDTYQEFRDSEHGMKQLLCMEGALNVAATGLYWQPDFTLSEMVAAHLPDHCTEHGWLQSEADGRAGCIWHHNDFHCEGGEDAARVLEEVAEKIEANR